MRHITVIGTGYVGLSTGVSFADMGNMVVCLDIDEQKIDDLRRGILPIHEPGLQEVVARNLTSGRLSFTTSYRDALAEAEFVFIAVGTPDDGSGGADLSQVRSAATSIGESLKHAVTVVNKSTVPIGTGDLVATIIQEHQQIECTFHVVSNPEFLREGTALSDCMHPDRVVLGADNSKAAEHVAELYEPLNCPIIITDLRTAEMIKYASNAFLATRISFINEIAGVCEQLGADVEAVARGMGYDKRIGPYFLNPGLGFGGSCFPKDVHALIRMAEDAGQHPQLLEAVMQINQDRREWAVDHLRARLGDLRGRHIALLGLAFKPDTDDIREAPALDLIRLLQAEGARISAYDPEAGPNVAALTRDVTLHGDAYSAATDADAVVIVTEWNEFKSLDLRQLKACMRGSILLDGRNVFSPGQTLPYGFDYIGVAPGQQANSQAHTDVPPHAPDPVSMRGPVASIGSPDSVV